MAEEHRINCAKRFIVAVNAGRDIVGPNATRAKTMSDLFCIVKYNKTTYRTPTIKYCSNPIWKIEYTFDVSETALGSFIFVKVYEDQLIGKQFVGQVMLPVVEHLNVSFEMADQHWFPIINKKRRDTSGAQGEIALRIGYRVDGTSSAPAYDPRYHKVSLPENVDNMTHEAIYKEANELAEANLDSVQRSLKIINQTVDIGHNSLAKLKEQGGRILSVQEEMERVEMNLVLADRRVRSIESPWGTLANKLTSAKNRRAKINESQERKIAKKRLKADGEVHNLKETEFLARRAYEDKGLHVASNHMLSRSDEVRTAFSGEEEQKFFNLTRSTDTHLNSIGNALQDLKLVALTMGSELQEQNERLQNLQHELQVAQPRVGELVSRCNTLSL